MKLSEHELEAFDYFIEYLDNTMGNAGSNDFAFPEDYPIEERIAMYKFHQRDMELTDDEIIKTAENKYTQDFLLLQYLVYKLKQ